MSRPRSLSLLFPSSEFTTKKGGEGEGGATINKVSISFFRWFCLNSKCLRFVSLQGATQDAGDRRSGGFKESGCDLLIEEFGGWET